MSHVGRRSTAVLVPSAVAVLSVAWLETWPPFLLLRVVDFELDRRLCLLRPLRCIESWSQVLVADALEQRVVGRQVISELLSPLRWWLQGRFDASLRELRTGKALNAPDGASTRLVGFELKLSVSVVDHVLHGVSAHLLNLVQVLLIAHSLILIISFRS